MEPDMSRNLVTLSLAATLAAGTALAEVPQVAVDIAPVHALVARVKDGVGTPSLIVQPGASPHEYSLRPSEAAALQDADVVFWVSSDLTPWLDSAIDTLAGGATVVELLESDGTAELEMRENALFEAHDHGEEDHGDDHGETGHDDHADHDGHGHADHDPHAWLSPDNGAVWLNTIAATLSAADPDNAGAYFANAAAGRAEIDALKSEISAILDPVRGRNFIVFHDAYQYFELAFDFPASGAISVSDATDPSPARIAEIQARVADQGVTCVLSEPQFNPGILAAVLDGTEAQTGVLDPLGSDLTPGADLYPQLLRNLATSLAACL
jgi:zinc transport system substrate-binding protein